MPRRGNPQNLKRTAGPGRPKGSKNKNLPVPTRQEVLGRFVAEGLIDDAIKSIRGLIAKNDAGTSQWLLNQAIGTPKSTFVQEINDEELLRIVARVTAEFMDPGIFDQWMQRLKAELSSLAGASESPPSASTQSSQTPPKPLGTPAG